MRRFLLVVVLLLAASAGVAAVILAAYSAYELHRFAQAGAGRAVRVYTAPQVLAPGVHVRHIGLPGLLARLRYGETPHAPATPGQFRRVGAGWDIHLREMAVGPRQPAQRVRIEVKAERIVRLTAQGRPLPAVMLEPEILTGAGDAPGEQILPVGLGDVPQALRDAVLAAEDHRFLEHRGIDLHGVARAVWVNLRAARVVQGGSTITQQLVKNRILSHERTLARKAREAWIALLVEWRYPKDSILEQYLNEVYLGHRDGRAIRGVGAAARTYFGTEAHQLTLGESALLAGMIRAPSTYSPLLDRNRARQRRDQVLARMRELGTIAPAEHEHARGEPLRARPAGGPRPLAPYFADHARRQTEGWLGEVLGRRDAAHIVTSLDPTLQRFAESAVARGLDRLERQHPALRRGDPGDRLQAALLALEPRSGHIRAMVGGRDYRASQFNRAVLAARQPGSAFKPVVYLAALERWSGPPVLTAASLVEDAPITVVVDGKPWSPRNDGDRYEGRVTVRRALEASLNGATVRVAQHVGLAALIATARRLGLQGALAATPAAALGAFEVTPLDLARAYVPLANGGRRLEAHAVSSVQDADGQMLWNGHAPGEPVLSAAEAYLMTSLLEGVMRSGTAAAAGPVTLPAAVAGKTGTTNEARDAWFVGYSSNLVALVWVGFDSSRPHGLSGTQAALPIWVDFMRQALDTYPAAPFAVPDGVVVAEIDPTNGLRATPACPRVVREVFLTGTEPPICEEHRTVGERLRRRFWEPLLDWFRRR